VGDYCLFERYGKYNFQQKRAFCQACSRLIVQERVENLIAVLGEAQTKQRIKDKVDKIQGKKEEGNMGSSSTVLPIRCDACGKEIDGEVFQILGQTVRDTRNTSPHRPTNFCKTCFNTRLKKINKGGRRDKSHGDI